MTDLPDDLNTLPELGIGYELPPDLNTLPELGIGYRVEIRNGREVRVPTRPPTCAFWLPADQVMAWTDENGVAWTLARTTDGKWWKRPAGASRS